MSGMLGEVDAPLVTGMGCVSALGVGVQRFWDALVSGQSGIREITGFETAGLRATRAGAISLTPAMREHARRQEIPSRIELFTSLAIDEALADAGLGREALRGRRSALIIGTSLGMSLAAPDLEGQPVPPSEVGGTGADLAGFADGVARRYGLEGRTLVVSTACASGTHAIGMARDMILAGCDLVVAGGADTLDRMKYLGHSALATLTPDLPKPFSRHRAGTLFGEGAAFVVLEPPSTARRRAYACCRGAGFSTDIHHLTAPDPDGHGATLAMRAALADAGLEPDGIDHVNLHGSGTDLNDVAEALALRAVFGERARALPCTSIKPAVGHAMGAAGAIEAVATVLSVYTRRVPRTLNVSSDDVCFEVGLVTSDDHRSDIRHAMSNSFGFGGANGAVIFGRIEREG